MIKMQRLLVTGSSGFIGKALVETLLARGVKLTTSCRTSSQASTQNRQSVTVGDLLPSTDWTSALQDVDTVIHLAARVHIMRDTSNDPLAEFRQTNVEATLNLAKQAASLGIKRFIFISSIKADQHLREQEQSCDPYGQSKHEAEQALLTLSKQTNLNVIIIRPPLVYGPYVKGNFALLLKCIQKSIPLPLGAINNQRSLVALDNLVDFIIHTTHHPKASTQILTISDDKDVSTTELLNKIAIAFDKTAYLIPIPETLLAFAFRCIGKGAIAERLMGSLQVDSTPTKQLLDWKPVISMDTQLKKMANSRKNETIY